MRPHNRVTPLKRKSSVLTVETAQRREHVGSKSQEVEIGNRGRWDLAVVLPERVVSGILFRYMLLFSSRPGRFNQRYCTDKCAKIFAMVVPYRTERLLHCVRQLELFIDYVLELLGKVVKRSKLAISGQNRVCASTCRPRLARFSACLLPCPRYMGTLMSTSSLLHTPSRSQSAWNPK